MSIYWSFVCHDCREIHSTGKWRVETLPGHEGHAGEPVALECMWGEDDGIWYHSGDWGQRGAMFLDARGWCRINSYDLVARVVDDAHVDSYDPRRGER